MTPRLFIDFDDQLAVPQLLAMARLACPFDYDAYFKLENVDRKAMVANTLRAGLTHFAEQMGEDPTSITEAFTHMQAAEFRFQGALKQRYPGGRLTARVEFDYGTEGMEIVAAFSRKGSSKIISRKPMGLCAPHPWLLNNLYRGCGWSGTRFQVKFPPFNRSVETKSIK